MDTVTTSEMALMSTYEQEKFVLIKLVLKKIKLK